MSDTVSPVYSETRAASVPTASGGSGPFDNLTWRPKGTAESGWWWLNADSWCAEIGDTIAQAAIAIIGPDGALVPAQLNWTAYPTRVGILFQAGGTPGCEYTACLHIVSTRDVNVGWAGEVTMPIGGSITFSGDPSLVTSAGDVVELGGVPFPSGTQPTGPVQPATEMQSMPALAVEDLPSAVVPVLLPPLPGTTVWRLRLATTAQVGAGAASVAALQTQLDGATAQIASMVSEDEVTMLGQPASAPYLIIAAFTCVQSGTGYLRVLAGINRFVGNYSASPIYVLPPPGLAWEGIDVADVASEIGPQNEQSFSVLPSGRCIASGA